jgi:hypothetical protein
MGLLDTIIGVVERTWREHPRKNVVNAMARLRNSMVQCQEAYEKYQTLVSQQPDYKKSMEDQMRLTEEVGTHFDNPLYEWNAAVNVLSQELTRVSYILKIFDNETLDKIYFYKQLDTACSDTTNAEIVISGLSKKMQETPEIDIKPAGEPHELKEAFNVALKHIDKFLKDNFKIEEIYAAGKEY